MVRAGKGLRRLWRWLAGAVAALALLAALGVGAFRLAIELLPGYQQQIADQIRAATGLRLEFDSLNARIGRYGPEIQFSGARVLPILLTAKYILASPPHRSNFLSMVTSRTL